MFKSNHRVISIDSKLSCIVHEIIDIKHNYIVQLTVIKIVAYQDNIKRFNELSFFEYLNVRCNAEAKRLISDAITANYALSLPFQFNSSVILNKVKLPLISTEMIRDETYLQLAFSYLAKKLSTNALHETCWDLRKSIINLLPKGLCI